MKNPFRRKAITASPEILEALAARQLQPYRSLGGTNINTQRINSVFVQHQSASYAYLYTHQPAVRSVVDYLARNIAQLGLKVYERVSDDEREHVGDHPAAEALRNPNPFTPGQQFIFNLVADFMVYDNAYIWKFRARPQDGLVLINVPPGAVGIIGRQRFMAEGYRFYRADGTYFDVPPSDVLHWRGYDPDEPRMGISKLETLREELAADAAARSAKTELDRAGLIPKGWIERPEDAPEWTEEAMSRFRESWANWAKNSSRTTPVLEDGMEFKQSSVSPEDAQLLESRTFTKTEVASIFGLGNIPPKDEEERQQVYADVLRPYCEMLCSYLDLSILLGEFDETKLYTEFNLDEKYMGDNRLKALTSATGRPVMLTNEGRARLNLPPVDGGDELVTPANVIVGDNPKPSTDVMPIQDPNGPSQDGDHREDEEPKALEPAGEIFVKRNDRLVLKEERLALLSPRLEGERARHLRAVNKFAADFERFYGRMARSLRNKADVDEERWAKELGQDLHDRIRSIVEAEADLYVIRLLGDRFDMGQVEHLLEAAAYGAADGIVSVTVEEIDELGLQEALLHARGERAGLAASSLGASSMRYARTEAAKQAPNPERRLKMWVADTKRHANLHGAVVPLDQTWGGTEPGQPANCKCTVSVI